MSRMMTTMVKLSTTIAVTETYTIKCMIQRTKAEILTMLPQ